MSKFMFPTRYGSSEKNHSRLLTMPDYTENEPLKDELITASLTGFEIVKDEVNDKREPIIDVDNVYTLPVASGLRASKREPTF